MSAKSKQCSVTIVVSEKERNFFTAMARDLYISRNVLMRRLVRYFLEEKISWSELFKKSSEHQFLQELDGTKKRQMRTYLEPEQYAAFSQLAEEWGSTTSVVLKRMIQLYITGKIERGNIWQ
jgi:hypothetical protein